MSGGHDALRKNRAVINLKLLVDKARNRVIFVESDHELVDRLLDLLTRPIGSAVGWLITDSKAIGSLTTMYNSLSSLESRHLRTDHCKDMLLSKLMISVAPPEDVKLYTCEWCEPRYTALGLRLVSTIAGRQCECPRTMRDELQKGAKNDRKGGGMFIKDGAVKFMITDDLQVMPGSTSACLSLFRKLGIDDWKQVEERTLEFGEEEVFRLLKFAMLSKSPLTDAVLYGQCSSERTVTKFQLKRTPQPDKDGADKTNNMTLKLFVSKSNKKKILYAEAGAEVVDFLFSILTYPLGSIIKLLDKNSGFGCMDNLFKGAESLGTGGYLKSEECRKMLLCPKLAPFHSVGDSLLQIEEASYPMYVFDPRQGLWVAAEEESSSPSTELLDGIRLSAIAMDPKSLTGEVDADRGYLKGPATFMILNDLSVVPLSPVASVALLNKMNVPIKDVLERIVTIGCDEALNLLNASLISKTVLSDVFNQRETSPEVMLKV